MSPSFLSRLVIILLATSSLSVHAKDQIDTIALNRVFNYRSVMQDNIEGTTMNVYLRYHLRTDKKNTRYGEISFTLLSDVGQPVINQVLPDIRIKEALDYLFSL